jgi:hypothetical protein
MKIGEKDEKNQEIYTNKSNIETWNIKSPKLKKYFSFNACLGRRQCVEVSAYKMKQYTS